MCECAQDFRYFDLSSPLVLLLLYFQFCVHIYCCAMFLSGPTQYLLGLRRKNLSELF